MLFQLAICPIPFDAYDCTIYPWKKKFSCHSASISIATPNGELTLPHTKQSLMGDMPFPYMP